MKAFLEGVGKALSWIFGRLPSEGQSLRAEIDRLEREYDRVLQKKTSMATVNRLRAISNRLRVLYAKAANKAP
jgi:hypothetical protein